MRRDALRPDASGVAVARSEGQGRTGATRSRAQAFGRARRGPDLYRSQAEVSTYMTTEISLAR